MTGFLYYPLLLASGVLGVLAMVVAFLRVIGYVGVPLLIGVPVLAYLAVVLGAAFVLVRLFPPRGRRLLVSNLVLLGFGALAGFALGMTAL